MTLEIYKLSIFFICMSIGVQFVELSGIVPDTHTGYADKYVNNGLSGQITGLVSYMFGNTVPSEYSYLILSLALFSLLVFTLPIMLAIFWIGYFLGADVISKLPLSTEMKAGLLFLLAIIYIVGYQQYKANVSLRAF